MIVVTAISHRDIECATRLAHWLKFLSGKDGGSLKQAAWLIVANPLANRRQRMAELLTVAQETFGETYLLALDSVDESGWPKSCNAMFRASLCHVEEHWQDDMFWLEPDAVLLTPEWLAVIQSEFDVARISGKSFMGAHVPHRINHMSGVAVYGKNWRDVAPSLVDAATEAWDTFAAHQVVPHAHFTPAIQHKFHGPKIRSLGFLSPGAVIFHQDKTGELIKRLDRERYGGELYGNAADIIAELEPMPKYFHARNASRTIAGLRFDIYSQRAGTSLGVFEAVSDADIAALESEAANPRSAVTEITADEYAASVKKKPRISANVISLNRPIVQIKPSAAVPQGPNAVESVPSPSPEAPKFEKPEDFLKVGVIGGSKLPVVNSQRPR